MALFGFVLFTTRSEEKPEYMVLGFTLLIALAFGIWLAGFKITIAGSTFTYRDGLYKSYVLPCEFVEAVEVGESDAKGSRFRLVIRIIPISGSGYKVIEINPKPFPRNTYSSLTRLLQDK